MLLSDVLSESAARWPDRTAVTMRMGYRTVDLSYGDLQKMAQRVAALLEQEGIEKGDRVLLLAPNSPYWAAVFFGCVLRGCIVVPLNVQSTGKMLQKIAKQTEAKILFAHLHFVEEIPEGVKKLTIDFLPELIERFDASSLTDGQHDTNDVAMILYTSGTTSDPKGVELTHSNLIANLEALSKVLPLPTEARFLSILPLSHSFEQMGGFLLPLLAGAKIVYTHSPAAISQLLKEHRITHMVAVPEFLQLLMRKIETKVEESGKKSTFEHALELSRKLHLKLLQRFLFRSIHKQFGGKLHTIASGGAPLDPVLEAKWSALGIDILQGYGLTETSPVVTTNTYAHRRPGAVGKVLPGVEVKLGEGKEILVRGPNVFQSYFRDEKKTKEAFTLRHLRQGKLERWYRTGDIGELDADGFLYIKGRKKYIILGPGGQNVYPEDVEEALRNVEDVRDCCVVGLEREGQAEIHAVLLLAEDVLCHAEPFDSAALRSGQAGMKHAQGIIEQANERLASYQHITGFSIWAEEDFPRSATRKVQKEKVLRWLREQEQDGEVVRVTKATLLQRILSQVTGINAEQIHEDANLARDLKVDSLLRIELLARIEERFGKEIDEAEITTQTNVSDLREMLEKRPVSGRNPLKRWPRWGWVSALRTGLQYIIVFPILKIFVHLRIEGREYLDTTLQPIILMPNHTSYIDSAILTMALPQRIRRRAVFAAARDWVYEHYPQTLSTAFELLFNCFPFPRKEGERIREGLEHMGSLLDGGWSIVVFPEGQMSESGELLPLKRGTGLVATQMDAPVIPVKIQGTREILPYAKIVPRRRGRVTVTFGEPMHFKRSDSGIEVTERIEEMLKDL